MIVPNRITEGFQHLRDGFASKLGFDTIVSMMQPVPGEPDFVIYAKNPFPEFSGVSLPEMRAELNLNELAQQQWVSMLRMVLLFIVVMTFVSAVVTTLRQG